MKIIAHREKDLRDIENIMRVCPRLDLDRIRYWLHEFALVLENPEVDLELSKLIDR